ncbi:hypothetical protein CERSUDRAFT_112006 [Gelatoporia subvermispora B]|uniref:Uncharacterized protein n=1 Tax=Ceriporiopsis subvermispora (strain B) TaxID=914234 RepID=M2RLH4_CERS8|nr:hypothetical protein CERSUDRAFT_112006 [Gelatoporia subvermispora B]
MSEEVSRTTASLCSCSCGGCTWGMCSVKPVVASARSNRSKVVERIAPFVPLSSGVSSAAHCAFTAARFKANQSPASPFDPPSSASGTRPSSAPLCIYRLTVC